MVLYTLSTSVEGFGVTMGLRHWGSDLAISVSTTHIHLVLHWFLTQDFSFFPQEKCLSSRAPVFHVQGSWFSFWHYKINQPIINPLWKVSEWVGRKGKERGKGKQILR